MSSHWFQHPLCEAFPMAHFMRQAFPETWLRIHSLPESKRYPEDDTERQIVFDRYSRFGSALLGESASCFIIQSRFIGFPRSSEFMPELDWAPIHRVGDENQNEEEVEDVWDSWMAHTIWQPSAFRSLLLDIADDKEAHIAFLTETTDCIFIPYDGGADGFSFDKAFLQRLSGEFAPWLSAHPLGL
jgi:hypothetical protein